VVEPSQKSDSQNRLCLRHRRSERHIITFHWSMWSFCDRLWVVGGGDCPTSRICTAASMRREYLRGRVIHLEFFNKSDDIAQLSFR
jgi:hypothetical protein